MEKEEIKKSCARLQGQRATNPQCGTIVLIGVKGLLFSKRPSRWYAQISFIESQCNYVPHSKPRFGVQLGTSLGKTSSQNKVSGHLPLENMFIPFARFPISSEPTPYSSHRCPTCALTAKRCRVASKPVSFFPFSSLAS